MRHRVFVAFSHDRGKTWRPAPIRGPIACNGGGTYLIRVDPDLRFDPWGRLYLSESVVNPFADGTGGLDGFSVTAAPGSDRLGPRGRPLQDQPDDGGAKLAAVRIAISGNRGVRWKLLRLGKPFLISSLGPTDDSSPLGPVQGIIATPTGLLAAVTVGGSLVRMGGGSDVDLIFITKRRA